MRAKEKVKYIRDMFGPSKFLFLQLLKRLDSSLFSPDPIHASRALAKKAPDDADSESFLFVASQILFRCLRMMHNNDNA